MQEPLLYHPSQTKMTELVLLFPGQGGPLPSTQNSFSVSPYILEILGYDPLAKYLELLCPVEQQIALFAVQYTIGNTLAKIALEEGDIQKIFVCGHSLGEYTASVIAGMTNLNINPNPFPNPNPYR